MKCVARFIEKIITQDIISLSIITQTIISTTSAADCKNMADCKRQTVNPEFRTEIMIDCRQGCWYRTYRRYRTYRTKKNKAETWQTEYFEISYRNPEPNE